MAVLTCSHKSSRSNSANTSNLPACINTLYGLLSPPVNMAAYFGAVKRYVCQVLPILVGQLFSFILPERPLNPGPLLYSPSLHQAALACSACPCWLLSSASFPSHSPAAPLRQQY